MTCRSSCTALPPMTAPGFSTVTAMRSPAPAGAGLRAQPAFRHRGMRAVCMPHQLAGDRAAAGRRGVGLPGPRRDRRLVSGAGTRDPAMTTRPIRYLIVNGDDFGLTDGVNRGI